MRIDLDTIDRESFSVMPRDFYGETVYLVNPVHVGCKWTQDNLHFRSSVWNADGELISAGFKKFFNLEERPDIDPLTHEHLKDAVVVEKLDGSTFIVSRYKGNWMFRTRGTIDATGMPNGHEIEIFKNKYSDFINTIEDFADFSSPESYIFEWTSPQNKIVLDYGPEPTWTLLAVIGHRNYETFPLWLNRVWAIQFGFSQPPTYSFSSLEELTTTVRALKGKEGVCLYYNDGQSIRKIKSLEYLKLHAFKSNCNLESITDLYFTYNQPTRDHLTKIITDTFDFECATMAAPFIDSLYSAIDSSRLELLRASKFVAEHSELEAKDFAGKLLAEFNGPITAIAFNQRRGKIVEPKMVRKHIEHFFQAETQ